MVRDRLYNRTNALTETSVTPSNSRSMPSNTSKKSSRNTCFGTTHRVSISELGPCTPKRYEPKVKILPPAALAAASDSPRVKETWYTNFLTSAATRPRTASLRKAKTISAFSVVATNRSSTEVIKLRGNLDRTSFELPLRFQRSSDFVVPP